jgi:hypothetical protein
MKFKTMILMLLFFLLFLYDHNADIQDITNIYSILLLIVLDTNTIVSVEVCEKF